MEHLSHQEPFHFVALMTLVQPHGPACLLELQPFHL